MRAMTPLLIILASGAWAQPPATCERGLNPDRIAACTELLRQDQSSDRLVSIYGNRAQAYSQSHQHELAVKDYDAALAIDPDNIDALYGRGWALHRMNLHERAVADADRMIAMGAKAATYGAHQLRCQALARMSQFDEAIRSCTEQLAFHGLSQFSIDRGNVYLEAGQPDLAMKDFDAALGKDQNNAWAILGRGKALLAKMEYSAALTEFDRANNTMMGASGQPWGFALSGRGLANEALGQRDKAIADFQAALNEHSDLSEAMTGLRRLGGTMTAPSRERTAPSSKPWWQFWRH
jgi:tetratricopeptide (TPR) repeat protein